MASQTQAPKRGKGKAKKNRVGIDLRDEERIRRRLRGSDEHGNRSRRELGDKTPVYPSEPWIDTQFATFLDVDPEGDEIAYRFHKPGAFPPGQSKTLMVVCPECGRTVPPNSLEGGRCMDHQPERLHDAYGSSPSAAAIWGMQLRHEREEKRKLKSESKADLRQEIRLYEKHQAKKKRTPPLPI